MNAITGRGGGTMRAQTLMVFFLCCAGVCGLGVSTAYADYNWPFGDGPKRATHDPDSHCGDGGRDGHDAGATVEPGHRPSAGPGFVPRNRRQPDLSNLVTTAWSARFCWRYWAYPGG